MELWAELFSDWVGILSFIVLVGCIVIGGVFLKIFMTDTSKG